MKGKKREGEEDYTWIHQFNFMKVWSYFVPMVRRKLIAPTMNNTPKPTRVDADMQTSARGTNASLYGWVDEKRKSHR
jgi:hypothetical protein